MMEKYSINEAKEKTLIKLASNYRKEYKNCVWWKFKKRYELYAMYQSAIDLLIKYYEMNKKNNGK